MSTVISEHLILQETTQYTSLTITESASISAPVGKNLTMTVDGIHKDIVPGKYSGNIVLTVTDGFGRTGGFGPPGPDPVNFTAAIRGENGSVCEEKSVMAAVQGGTITDGTIADVKIISQGNKLGGLDLKDGNYTVKNAYIKMDGYGGNDFSGHGAAISVSGNAHVDIENLNIINSGVIRSGLIATDDTVVTVVNSTITAMGGDEKQYQAADADVGGMLCVPWQLGLSGNCRTTSVLTRGTVEYIGCKLRSWGWGVLSVDGTAPSGSWEEFSIHLKASDCQVDVLGPSGYGAFAIGPCKDIFKNTIFTVPDYSLIQANETASAHYVGCTVNSKRFGTMSYANQGGKITLKDSTFNTGSATFLVKGCYPQITVDNSKLNSVDGTVLQLMDCDDPNYGLTGMDLDAQVPEKIQTHDVTKTNYHDFYLYNELLCTNKPTDLQVTFKDMTLNGNFYNAISNNCPVGTYNPNPSPMGPPPEQLEKMIEKGEIEPPAPDDMPNFTKTPSTNYPVNMVVQFINTTYEGILTASVARHNVKRSGKENFSQLGVVTNTPCPVVNNGVIVSFDEKSSWTVTDTCYLSALTIAEGAKIFGKNGQTVVLAVNGTEIAMDPGTYTGNLVVSLK